jgi:hypothetical protein
MGAALAVTRLEHNASEFRSFAAKSGDGPQVRRLLAIALVLEGYSRTEAAELSGMDRQTLRDWVHRYNDEGIDGLKSRSSRSPSWPSTSIPRASLLCFLAHLQRHSRAKPPFPEIATFQPVAAGRNTHNSR